MARRRLKGTGKEKDREVILSFRRDEAKPHFVGKMTATVKGRSRRRGP
ncbi:MAG TPA: hypothetical protein VHR72_11615 [Gemmataceae bacterium]|nr:hypothetical protein [Gemmataceae bacterium]